MPEVLTVNQVRGLVESAGADWAVVIAGRADGTQFVTWGRAARDKVYASELSAHLGEYLCGPEVKVVYEDFKLEAARNKADLEGLRDAARAALALLERFPAQTALLLRQGELEDLRRLALKGGTVG